MAWIYLVESEDSRLHSASGYDQSPIAKLTPIVKEFSSVEWPRLRLPAPQSGMTYEAFQRGYPYLTTSFTEASRARISALQDAEKAWKESEADYFSRSCAWPKKSSPSSYFLKTCPPSPAVADFESLVKLPKWGIIVGGVLYPLLPLEHYTVEKGGSYLPIPNTLDHLPCRSVEAQQRVFQTHRKGRTQPCNLREWFYPKMWPTPKASDATRAGIKSESKRDNPALWYRIHEITGKKLNVLFLEWMMGYPEEWTELEPWAMRWFLSKRKRRSKY